MVGSPREIMSTFLLLLILVTGLLHLAITQPADVSQSHLRAQVNLAQHLARRPVTGRARNVVLVIGDAEDVMSLASRRHKPGGLPPALKRFPYVGLCTAAPGTISACSSFSESFRSEVSWEITVKRNCSAAQDPQNQNHSILRKAQLAGKATGLVTASRVTRGASRGGSAHYYAHVAYHDWESDVEVTRDGEDPQQCDDIAEQLVYGDTGRDIQVVLGWGRSNFRDPDVAKDEECVPGRREDGADLIREWRRDKLQRRAVHAFVWDTQSLRAQNLKKTKFLMGLFEQSPGDGNELHEKPTLAEMTEAALTVLMTNPRGFFLILEGRHSKQRSRKNERQRELEDALQRALDLTNPQETLVVVTALHSKTMSFQANLTGSAQDGGETSGASVFARGPWAQLLTGTFEQYYIEYAVTFAACLGEGFTACTR